MDVNNTQPAATVAAPVNPSEGNNEQSSSPNKIIWLIIGLVVVILIIGGGYLYMGTAQKAAPKPSPSPKASENLESELNKIEVGDLDEEFSEVDKDLETL